MILRTWPLKLKGFWSRSTVPQYEGDMELRLSPQVVEELLHLAYLASNMEEWGIVWDPSDPYEGPKCIVSVSQYVVAD